MMRVNIVAPVLALLFAPACKQDGMSSQAASTGDSRAVSEKCGVVQLKDSEFSLLMASGESRAIDPQDGAVVNALSDAAGRKETLCLRADWSTAAPALIVSTAFIRRPVTKTIVSEECGVLMMSTSGKITLQISGYNSEQNVNRELDPQDGATTELLKDYASKATQVCVKGDFSDSAAAVMVTSQASVRLAK